jgi:ribosomal protein S18 acetylase RimI-like enzyme
MAGLYAPEGRAEERHVWGMWVAPEARGRGIGRRLINAAIEFAADGGAERLTLWVVDDNEAARAVYASAGFRKTDTTQPLPSHPDLIESLWERPLT